MLIKNISHFLRQHFKDASTTTLTTTETNSKIYSVANLKKNFELCHILSDF